MEQFILLWKIIIISGEHTHSRANNNVIQSVQLDVVVGLICVFAGELIQLHSDNVGRKHKVVLAEGDFAQLLIDWGSSVIEWRALKNDAQSAANTREGEHPEEEPIQHHRHKLPVLDNLQEERQDNKIKLVIISEYIYSIRADLRQAVFSTHVACCSCIVIAGK